jgi:hypothetical protein
MARQYRSTVEAKTLSAGINNSVTSMTLNSVTTLPSSYPYTLVIDPDLASEEIVTVTASSGGNVLTITRGQDGTSAQSHNAAAVVKHMITARDLQEPHDHIDATAAHGATGAIVGTTNTQTLTNKTITGGTVNPTTLQQGGIQAVTTTGTQTLTNKTLTSPAVTSATLSGTTNANSGTIALGTNASAITANSTTISATEVGYLDGVTSAIQTQLNTKAPSANPTFTGTVVLPSTTSIGTVSSTEIGYVDGVTSAIQTQLDSKAVQGSGGLPYRMSSGIGSTTFTASATSGVTTVNFPTSRFTEAPVVVAQVNGFAGSLAGATIRVANVTDTSFQMTMTLNASTTTTANFHWTAVQMTTSPYTVGTAQ